MTFLETILCLLAGVSSAAFVEAGAEGLKPGQASTQAHAKAACETLSPSPDDALVASPANHTLLFEDADVRVLDVHSKPHTREAVHSHALPSVMYVERQGAGTYDTADGSVHRSHPADPNFKPRVLAIQPEGPHWTENTGDIPFHAIRVEFKHPGCGLAGRASVSPAADGPLPTAGGSRALLFENDEVEVLDVRLVPHGSEVIPPHPWPGFFYVADAASIRLVDKESSQAKARRFPSGVKIFPVDGEREVIENLGDHELHLIRFELKYGTYANR